MSTKIPLKFDKIIGPLGIFFLSLVFTFIWFSKGLMFAGGEEGLPFYNLTKYLTLMSHIWQDSDVGFPIVLLLPRIPYFSALEFLFKHGIGSITLQALTFLILILTGCLSVFYLVKETIGDHLKGEAKTFVPLLSGIFYLLNPFSMTQVWGRGLYAQFFAFALVPLFLLFFILAVKRKNIIYLGLAIIVSYFFSPAFVFPTQVAVLWIPVFIYLAFYFLENKGNKKEILFSISFFIILIISWLLVHAWWIIPNYKLGNQIYSTHLNDLEANLGTLRGVSRQYPLSAVIRLLHNGYFYEGEYYGEIYSNFLFAVISWLIPLVALFSISTFKKLRHFKFYILLFLISLFVSLGSNPPLGWLFEWAFKRIPYLQAFRNPFEKFGLVYLIAYVPFFALGSVVLSNKLSRVLNNYIKSRSILFVIAFLVCGVFVWPLWFGNFAGGFKINPWVKVPEYYKGANEWLKSQTTSLRSIQFPLNPGDGVRFNWQHPYRGIEPSEFLFTNPSIGRNIGFNKIYYNVLLERFGVFQPNIYGPDPDISRSEFRGENLYQELEKLGVEYIILHRDMDTSLSGMKSVEETISYLSKEKNIKKVKTIGELDIYKVDLSKDVDIIYSPDAPTTFSKVNPTLYAVRVKNAKGPINLYFLELFDNGWEAYIDGRKINNHYKIFSYANAWRIEREGDYLVRIKYQPQDFVDMGKRVSLYSFFLLGTIGGIYSIWRKRIF